MYKNDGVINQDHRNAGRKAEVQQTTVPEVTPTSAIVAPPLFNRVNHQPYSSLQAERKTRSRFSSRRSMYGLHGDNTGWKG